MLKTVYDTQEDIPAGYEALYTEKNGKWELTGIQGVKTQADIDRVQQALVKERNEHKSTREKLTAFGELDPVQVQEKLENFDSMAEQLEALKKTGGAFDEEKMEPVIQARVRQALGPIEREKTTLQRKLEDANKALGVKDNEIGGLKSSITSDRIERAVRDAALTEKVIPTAISDAVLHARGLFEIEEGTGKIITKDGVNVTPGLSPKEWLEVQKENAPHWWPASVGGGASGGGGPKGAYSGANNPWSKEGWSLTKQGALVKSLGEEKAAAIAAQAGSKIGATKPSA